MPEHESGAAAAARGVAGGYPPMTPLRDAVPGWPEEQPLTSVSTPEAARAVLRAEAETSVLHPTGLRWRVVRRTGQAVRLVGWLWLVVTLVRAVLGGDDPALPVGPVAVMLVASLATGAVPWSRLRADPSPGSLPSTRAGRVRLTLAALRGELAVTPAASWPPGSEAFALLSTVAATDGIDRPWLLDRARLPQRTGEQWLAALARSGWLRGGEPMLGGRLRQPVRITPLGQDRLGAERARLQALGGA